jgi:hypothetical protein
MPGLWSPGDVMAAVEPWISSELLSPARLERCRTVAASLPRAMSSYYLECRLDADDQVDFLTLTKHPRASRLFAESLGEAARSSPWRETLALFEDWCDGAPDLSEVPFFWLEYDIDRRFRPDAPLASPGFCLEAEYLTRFTRSPLVEPQRMRRIATAALSRLLDPERARRSQGMLERCIDALPRGGSLIHLSAMLAREPSKLKLYLAIPRSKMFDYLGHIGWRGSAEAVRELLATTHASFEHTVYVDVSLGDEVDDLLGLALSQFYQTETPDFTPGWDWLELPGVCESKRRAAARWPGVSVTTLGGDPCWIERWLDLKIVVDGDGQFRHKAYLGFMPSPPPPFS